MIYRFLFYAYDRYFLKYIWNHTGAITLSREMLWGYSADIRDQSHFNVLSSSPPHPTPICTPGDQLDCNTRCLLAIVVFLLQSGKSSYYYVRRNVTVYMRWEDTGPMSTCLSTFLLVQRDDSVIGININLSSGINNFLFLVSLLKWHSIIWMLVYSLIHFSSRATSHMNESGLLRNKVTWRELTLPAGGPSYLS